MSKPCSCMYGRNSTCQDCVRILPYPHTPSHILTPPHPHTPTSSHPHILTPPHPHTPTSPHPPHPHILTSSHSHILMQSYAAEAWTGFLFHMKFVGVQLEFLQQRQTEIPGSLGSPWLCSISKILSSPSRAAPTSPRQWTSRHTLSSATTPDTEVGLL